MSKISIFISDLGYQPRVSMVMGAQLRTNETPSARDPPAPGKPEDCHVRQIRFLHHVANPWPIHNFAAAHATGGRRSGDKRPEIRSPPRGCEKTSIISPLSSQFVSLRRRHKQTYPDNYKNQRR